MKRRAKPGPKPLPPSERQSEIVQTRCTRSERERWERAAATAGTTIAAQARAMLTRWAKRVLGPETSLASQTRSRGSSRSSNRASVRRSDAGEKSSQ